MISFRKQGEVGRGPRAAGGAVVKLALISVELDADLQWAVTLPPENEGGRPAVLAVFAYADHATRWGDENYKGRFKVVRTAVQQ